MLHKLSATVLIAVVFLLGGCASGPVTHTFKVIGVKADRVSGTFTVQKKSTETNETVGFTCDPKVVKKCASIKKGDTVTLTVQDGKVTAIGELKHRKKS